MNTPSAGDHVSTLADVARLAGVATVTAGRALSGHDSVSDETRQNVVEAARQLGYVATHKARSATPGHARTVGVLTPIIASWFFSEVLESLGRSLRRQGYDMTIYDLPAPSAERDHVFDYLLARKRFDALVAVGVALSAHEVDSLQLLGRPIVGIGGPIRGVHTIAIDDVGISRLATEHLLELGHVNVLHLGGRQTNQMDFAVHGQRLRGFTEAMESAGFSAEGHFRASEMTVPGGYVAGLAVLREPGPRPTAIFAASDEVAIGLIVAARELGIAIPEDLSVIGIDGHQYAEMFGLTTFEQLPVNQARLAVQLLLDELEASTPGKPAGDLTLFPTSLVVRTSTSAPRSA